MKNDMEDFIKNIIVEKKFFELTPKEKSIISEWAKNEEDFDALKLTFTSAEVLKNHKMHKVSPSVKEKLNERFAAKHAQENGSIWNKFLLFFFPRDRNFFKKPAFQLAMVALVVLLLLPFLWQDKPAQYVMHDSKIEIERTDGLDKLNEKRESEKSVGKVKEEMKSEELTLDLKENDDVIVEDLKIIPKLEAQPIPTIIEEESLTDEMYLEEVVEIQSDKKLNTEFQQMDMVPMISSKDIAIDDRKKSAKQIDASETLGLLTALY